MTVWLTFINTLFTFYLPCYYQFDQNLTKIFSSVSSTQHIIHDKLNLNLQCINMDNNDSPQVIDMDI